MMKTEISTNGEAPIEAREHRRATITQDHKRTGSAHLDEPGNRSGEEKKRSLFRRPGVIVAAAALAIAGIGYGGIAMFHSFTHETSTMPQLLGMTLAQRLHMPMPPVTPIKPTGW